MLKEKIESKKILDEESYKFNSEVYEKYYELEDEENLNLNLNAGMDRYSLLISFASLIIVFLFLI